ncbi:MAG: formylglycine-generating enzyme family protein [Deltaproteobacteria bacterium]|jgi:hypothetical protein|nr:formylglycine-generating enzyme family protein [Deltaproteobacteria bacterium]
MYKTTPVTLTFTDKLAAAVLVAALLALAAVILDSAPAIAQLRVANQATPQDASNPNPAEDDYVVPLPCELTMAFRPVFIPVTGYLGEMVGYFGSESRGEEAQGGDEPGAAPEAPKAPAPEGQGGQQPSSDDIESLTRRHKVYVGSPLSIDNLPAAYRPTALAIKNKLSADKKDRQLYLMGKYEVTVGQWDAVTKEGCPFDPKTAALPVANISWYEAQMFTYKLMSWLLANHPEVLPSLVEDDRMVGIVRLPTEDEWEYAARGGHLVSREDMSSQDLFPIETGKKLNDYGLYVDGTSETKEVPDRIGRKSPNPAGMYDTVGNVAEMTMDPFKVTVGSRLHGSAGGFVLKGGSYRTAYLAVLPGARVELPFFYRSGPVKADSIGVRLILSFMNIGSHKRIGEIADELAEAAKTDETLVADDPIKTVDGLIQNAESDTEKAALRTLRTNLEGYNTAVNERRRDAARSQLMSVLNMMMSMRANNSRMMVAAAERQTAVNYIKRFDAQIKSPDVSAADKKTFQKGREQHIKNRDVNHKFIQDAESSFVIMRGRYEKLLMDVKNNFPSELVLSQLSDVGQDIIGDDYFNREMRSCFTNVDKHVKAVLKGASPSRIPRGELEVEPVNIKMPNPRL